MGKLEDLIKTNKFESAVHKAQLNVLVSAAWVRGRIAGCLRPFNITSEQYNVLRILRGQKKDGVPVKDITIRMLEPSSNTTRIIDKLVGKGLLVREAGASDRRIRSVSLTEDGRRLLIEIDAIWSVDTPHKGNLTEEEAQTLNALLDKMRNI